MGLIDPEYLRKHYARLSDEALMAVDRGELAELARALYDEEIEHRGLRKDQELPGVPTVPARPASPRLRDVKRAALVACIAAVLGVAIPMWNSTRQLFALESNIGELGAIAAILVGYVSRRLCPCFILPCIAMRVTCWYHGTRGGWLLIAVAVMGILSVAAIAGWMGSFRRASALDSVARPWTIGDTSTVLCKIADLAGILLLAALFRLAGDGSSERGVAVSKLLRLLTKIAVIAGGIVAVGCVVGLAATPWVYSNIRGMGYSNARWTFSRLAVDRVRTALAVTCVYVAPLWCGGGAGRV